MGRADSPGQYCTKSLLYLLLVEELTVSIKVSVTLRDSPQAIEQKIIRATARRIQTVLKQSSPAIRRRIQGMCEALIYETEEYQSLMTGELLGELGIPDVESRLRQIINTVKRSVQA